jgi:hypothetical protein
MNAYEALHSLTKQERKAMARDYAKVPIAWLYGMHGKPWYEQERRLLLIADAMDGGCEEQSRAAIAKLDEVTRDYAARFGKESAGRYGSIREDTVGSFINASYGAFGDRRVLWHRFATWVALRSITSHPKYKAVRASYQHIAALSLGFPTITAARNSGHDLSPNRAIYRQVQRSIRAFRDVGLVLVWRTKGYRDNWYSYLLSNPEQAYQIAAQRAHEKASRQAAQKLIQRQASEPLVITQTAAVAIYSDVEPIGWHDTALRQIPTGVRITATERIGNREYVMLTRCNATQQKTARAKLHTVVGNHVRCGT